MTTAHTESRTLVKSPPELWAELSDSAALARHLGEFGEIKITRLEPETTVAWEGERASGTVRLEPSGWGTKVTLTAQPASSETETHPHPDPEPELESPPPEPAPRPDLPPPPAPDPLPPAAASPRRRKFVRVLRALGLVAESSPVEPAPPVKRPEPMKPPEPMQPPEPVALEPAPLEPGAPGSVDQPPAPPGLDPAAVLTAALDNLGQAHHRPFSRS